MCFVSYLECLVFCVLYLCVVLLCVIKDVCSKKFFLVILCVIKKARKERVDCDGFSFFLPFFFVWFGVYKGCVVGLLLTVGIGRVSSMTSLSLKEKLQQQRVGCGDVALLQQPHQQQNATSSQQPHPVPHKALSVGSSVGSVPLDENEASILYENFLRITQPACLRIVHYLQIQKMMSTGYFTREQAISHLQNRATAAGFANPVAAAVTAAGSMVPAHLSTKKDGPVTTIDPYSTSPRDGVHVVDVGFQPVTEDITRFKVRFDENYIFCIEDIPLETEDSLRKTYLGWSIKRVKINEHDTYEYKDEKDGKIKKRFNFSGRFATLPELHKALVSISQSSHTEPMITKAQARELDLNTFGMIDISAASRPVYTREIFGFSNFRVYVEDTTYVNPSFHLVTYKALTLTKKKSEKSKTKSKNEKDFFVLHIPARRLPHLLLAVELAMEVNRVMPIDNTPIVSSCARATEMSSEVCTVKKARKAKAHVVSSSSSGTDSDTWDPTSTIAMPYEHNSDDDLNVSDGDVAAHSLQDNLEDRLSKKKKQRLEKKKKTVRVQRKKKELIAAALAPHDGAEQEEKGGR